MSFAAYQFVKGHNVIRNSRALECPLTQKEFSVPTNKTIDTNLVLGELLFGLGWGVAGLCPGPAMVLACAGYQNVLLRWWPMFFVGVILAEVVKKLQVRLKERRNKEVGDDPEPEKESEVDDIIAETGETKQVDLSDRSGGTAGDDTFSDNARQGACV